MIINKDEIDEHINFQRAIIYISKSQNGTLKQQI